MDPLGLEWVTIKGNDGSGNNTTVCWMGKAYYLLEDKQNKQYKCPAIKACLAEHEKNHIKEALREKPGLCVGVRGNRTAFSNDVPSLVAASELSAFEREKVCLNQFNDSCDEKCAKEIKSRLKAIETSIKEVKDGIY